MTVTCKGQSACKGPKLPPGEWTWQGVLKSEQTEGTVELPSAETLTAYVKFSATTEIKSSRHSCQGMKN